MRCEIWLAWILKDSTLRSVQVIVVLTPCYIAVSDRGNRFGNVPKKYAYLAYQIVILNFPYPAKNFKFGVGALFSLSLFQHLSKMDKVGVAKTTHDFKEWSKWTCQKVPKLTRFAMPPLSHFVHFHPWFSKREKWASTPPPVSWYIIIKWKWHILIICDNKINC